VVRCLGDGLLERIGIKGGARSGGEGGGKFSELQLAAGPANLVKRCSGFLTSRRRE